MNILITSIIDLQKTTNSRLHHFIEHLVSKGHNITVISIRDNWKKTSFGQNKELIKKIRVHYVTDKSIGPLMQKGKAFFRAGKIIEGIDLSGVDVHFSYNSLFLSYSIIRKLKKYNIKTVYDLADDLPDMIKASPHLPQVFRPMAGRVGKYILEKNLKNASFVTITADEFKTSLDIGRYPHELLPNGVNVKRFRPKKEKHKGIVVGYIGALREWVNLRPMLSAVKNLDSHSGQGHINYKIKVLIVGGEEDLRQYKEFVKQNGMEKLVEFTGNVPYLKVPYYISMMDIATIPFRKNRVTDGTCPLKLLEYMAMEKPVICTPLNEVRKMVANQVMYAGSEKEWEKQISLLYHDPVLRERLGKEGRKFVEERYNWKRICIRIENILKEHSKR